MYSISQPMAHAPPPSPTTQHRVNQPERSTRLTLHEVRTQKKQLNNSVSSSQSTLCFLGGEVSSTGYASALDSCSCPRYGKQLHAHLLKNGFNGREFVQTKLLQLYGKCGCFDDLVQVFDKMPERNLYTYTAVMNVFLENGLFAEAFECFEGLLYEGIELEFFVFPVALKICCGLGGLELGRQLHGLVMKVGVLSHIYVGNALIDMYGKCWSLSDAEKVFDTLLGKDCVSWNSMVTACASNGRVFEALDLLEKMLGEKDELRPNPVTWSALIGGFAQNGYDDEAIEVMYEMRAQGFELNARTLASILPACARSGRLRLGKEIYGYIMRRGFMSSPYIVNGLIDLYRRCGDMRSAYTVFDKFSLRDEVSFNTMIAGYCDNGETMKARELFDKMECEGRRKKDLISWNSMVSGYADNFKFDDALRVFIELLNKGRNGIEPDSSTLSSVLACCAEMGFFRLGKGVHSYCIVKGLDSNLFVGGALVEMYCHCGDIEGAEKALKRVPERDVVIWNALVAGYACCDRTESIQTVLKRMRDDGFEPNVYTWNGIIAKYVENEFYELALKSFSDMQVGNLRPDVYTVGIVLPACSKLATIERGKQIHAYAVRRGFESDAYIVAALVDMYSKCGVLGYAKLVHNWTKTRNLVTQNAMLNAYATHGFGEDGITFFREMLVDGFRPDDVTFLAVLSSCVHAGSVETGKAFFELMGFYGVRATLKHYTCMVDLLSRAGRVREAYEMIEGMGMEPDSVIWGALLGGCIIYGDVELGEIAACRLVELEPENSGNYVMLANLYASAGKWDEHRKVRQKMNDEQLYKNPGCSWIEDKNETHVFMASDMSHENANEIYDMLDNLTAVMRLEQV